MASSSSFAPAEEHGQDEEDVAELDDDMQAAIAGSVAPSPEDDEEDEDGDDGVEVAEHLKEAVEGNLRMKRLLERDDDEARARKRPRILTREETIIMKLLLRWQLQEDLVTKYVLKECTMEELDFLDSSSYKPDKSAFARSVPDMLAKYVNNCRERMGPGGGQLDVVSSFKFRFRLDANQEQLLRDLNHKDLRFVLNNFDGLKSLEACLKEASEFEPDEDSEEAALPRADGLSIVGMVNRLELIDAVADAAVFGDANLTFAMKLAKHRRALGHVGRVIATTFEDLETLQQRYPEIDESITLLEEHLSEVYHCVDCTRIAVDERFKGMEGSLGAVYYNYPHSGAVGGFFDSHPLVNWRHENLMRLFFRALRSFVKPGGSVKLASNMGAVGVRFSYIVNSAVANEFIHVETMPFLQWRLHRYGRSYGDRRDAHRRPDAKNNQSYNSQQADRDMVYCFSYAPSGETLSNTKIIVTPPSLKTLMACNDGPFQGLIEGGSGRQNLALQLRRRFVKEASGTHVG